MADLQLDWCSYEAAEYACERWHYSEVMPAGSTLKIGVWEDSEYVGAVVYTKGASPWLANPYEWLTADDVCELARVALASHETPTSRILSISLKLLRERCPGLRLVVSFADPKPGHDGTLYQASNWVYEGRSESATDIRIGSRVYHENSVGKKHGTSSVEKLREMYPAGTTIQRIPRPDKYKYTYPLDDATRQHIQKQSRPYP